MGRAIYTAPVGATVPLVTNVAKTGLAIITPAQFGADLTKFRIGSDGVTTTDKAIIIELVSYTADGTGTAGTIAQASGRVITAGFTSKYNYSVEPTTPTVIDRWRLTSISGTVVFDFGSDTPDVGVSTVLGLRLTAPTNAVNVDLTMWFGRC